MNSLRILSTGQISPIVGETLGRFGRIEVAAHTDEKSLISLILHLRLDSIKFHLVA